MAWSTFLPHWQKASNLFSNLPPHVEHVTMVTVIHSLLEINAISYALDWLRLERALKHCVALERVDIVLQLDWLAAESVVANTGNVQWRIVVSENILKQLGPRLRSLISIRFEDI